MHVYQIDAKTQTFCIQLYIISSIYLKSLVSIYINPWDQWSQLPSYYTSITPPVDDIICSLEILIPNTEHCKYVVISISFAVFFFLCFGYMLYKKKYWKLSIEESVTYAGLVNYILWLCLNNCILVYIYIYIYIGLFPAFL